MARSLARLALRRRLLAPLVALALCLVGAGGLLRLPAALIVLQEGALDRLVLWSPAPAPQGPPVLVVDIGASDETGQAWSRASSARLVAALTGAGVAAQGWDVVFAGSCGDDPGTAALAEALRGPPAVLGFLLSSDPAPPPAAAPALALGDGAGAGLWAAPGGEFPCPDLLAGGAGLAALSLPGDGAARVRMAPAAVTVGGVALPSLALETLRRAGALPLPLIVPGEGDGLELRLGDAHFPLAAGGMLRFRPSSLAARQARSLPAEAVLSGFADPARLRGAVVLVGSSLPQRGGLRPVALDPLYPSVQIAADLAQGLMAGRLPWRPAGAAQVEALGLTLGGLIAALALARLAPLAAFGLVLGLAALWSGGCLAVLALDGRLFDPALPPAILLGAVLAALVTRAASLARAEQSLRARVGQLLPAPVVARLIDTPGLLRLEGQRREVTVLFTDIEGFSQAANAMAPEVLIARLDRYFALVNAVILRHGGMIDKLVGDGVHALFNAPLDQPGHTDAALAAAAEIITATEAERAALGLGRTRIGIERGAVVLGDVGAGGRIDFTAHGPAVNLAARLQEAGKALGPAVIVGPAAAAAARRSLHGLGEVEIRSFGRIGLYTLDEPGVGPGQFPREQPAGT